MRAFDKWKGLVGPLIVAAVLATFSWVSGASTTSAVQGEKISTMEERIDKVETLAQETHDGVIEIRADVREIRRVVAPKGCDLEGRNGRSGGG